MTNEPTKLWQRQLIYVALHRTNAFAWATINQLPIPILASDKLREAWAMMSFQRMNNNNHIFVFYRGQHSREKKQPLYSYRFMIKLIGD
jgi:hypothetical protein